MRSLVDQKEESSGCSTPTESSLSLGTNSELMDFSGSSSSLRMFMPEKLQIVKPLEGKRMIYIQSPANDNVHRAGLLQKWLHLTIKPVFLCTFDVFASGC